MNHPFRNNSETEIPPPPPSFFLFNKITLFVAVAAFTAGFYAGKHMYDKTPKPTPDDPCEDAALAISFEQGHTTSCPHPRHQMSAMGQHGVMFCACKK